MKVLKKSLVLLLLPLLAFTAAHKYYVSVTNINYSEKDQAFQITTRIFIDDFEALLKERYGLEAKLATDKESKMADAYIGKYLKAKFLIHINGEQKQYRFLGKKYDNDIMVCYLEIPDIPGNDITSITVQNEVLTDLYDEQQNLVHVKVKGKKKSFVLIKENNKGMLNL
ncbi:DUF6702 family protein [Maribacter luteus]|uniref:DUF6702 family protein n=1 Tax=Maribacter luteus TaxID=2594478 RepID=UPI00249293AB|nr:DUF6702 family protein [Maribacter luteus]|tara:strand:- start:388 stop:894 length:507 start_codon:yes stop_codon:yes gene_type:complete